MKKMTKSEIEQFAVGYPYPTDYIEILLKENEYKKETVHNILLKPQEDVVKEVRRCLKNIRNKRDTALTRILNI